MSVRTSQRATAASGQWAVGGAETHVGVVEGRVREDDDPRGECSVDEAHLLAQPVVLNGRQGESRTSLHLNYEDVEFWVLGFEER